MKSNKLPPNWLTQGLTMVYKIVYLVKVYSIPLALVVNNYQTRVHLVHNGWCKNLRAKRNLTCASVKFGGQKASDDGCFI
jgi:hypothetical protein